MSDSTAAAALTAITSSASAHQCPSNDAETTVKRLFMVLHGWYGNQFLAKFSTGEVDSDGKDRGIKSARMVWTSELSKFSAETVMAAAARCKEDHQKFPPSLPEFLALCRACAPRHSTPVQKTGIGMSPELRSVYSRRARESAISRLKSRVDTVTGYLPLPLSLDGLKLAIAGAVACAGGDEAKELLRLEKMFPKKEMADA